MQTPPCIVAPSLLAADFRHLEKEVKSVEEAGADWHHLDIMDGHFVPNLSFSPLIQESLKAISTIYIDTHLMMTKPSTLIDSFIETGANNITIHVECDEDIEKTMRYIKSKGVDVGLSLKPNTSIEDLKPFLTFADLILVMTVEPGFGGQSFMNDMLEKIQWLANEREQLNLNYHIEVDGGINETTGKQCRDAGANAIVAGSYIYNHKDRRAAIHSLRPSAC